MNRSLFFFFYTLVIPGILFADNDTSILTFAGKSFNHEILLTSNVIGKSSSDGVVFSSGESDLITDNFNTVLINGYANDLNWLFEISGKSESGNWTSWYKGELKFKRQGRFWGESDSVRSRSKKYSLSYSR